MPAPKTWHPLSRRAIACSRRSCCSRARRPWRDCAGRRTRRARHAAPLAWFIPHGPRRSARDPRRARGRHLRANGRYCALRSRGSSPARECAARVFDITCEPCVVPDRCAASPCLLRSPCCPRFCSSRAAAATYDTPKDLTFETLADDRDSRGRPIVTDFERSGTRTACCRCAAAPFPTARAGLTLKQPGSDVAAAMVQVTVQDSAFDSPPMLGEAGPLPVQSWRFGSRRSPVFQPAGSCSPRTTGCRCVAPASRARPGWRRSVSRRN